MRVSIVIPAFNEEKRIEKTLKRIISYCKNKFDKYEIIVVDDASKDNTVNIVMGYKKDKIRIVKNKINRGKGFSVKKGILQARYALVLFSDSDLATPIEELSKFLKYIRQGYDIIIASRNLKESNIVVKQPLYRQLMGKTFPLLVNLIALRDFRDTQCGFKLFKTRIAKKIVKYQTFERFSFDIELLFIAKKMGCRIKEAPVKWVDKAGSKLNPLKDSISMFLDLIRLRINNLKGRYEVEKNGY
ncbi:glycosyltransferase family 2 protein [Candidatus Woesearchaeota archaeon]|nr:glycosyltransferase family 2 protein [Candidatus Woesearchaeota archaeon]